MSFALDPFQFKIGNLQLRARSGPNITAPGSVDISTFKIGAEHTITPGTASASGGGAITYQVRWLVGGVETLAASYTPLAADDGATISAQWRAVETGGTDDGTTGWQTIASGIVSYQAVDPVTVPQVAFSRSLDQTFTTGTLTVVNRFPAADFAGLDDLRLRIRGPHDGMYIGHQRGETGDDRFNFAAAPEQITFGGAAIVTQGVSETTDSDPISFTPNGTDNVLVAFELDASKAYSFGGDAGQALETFYHGANVEAGSTTKTGYTSAGAETNVYVVEQILSYDPPSGIYPGKIVVDGNSIVNGYGVNAGEDFPAVLANLTTAEVVELGVNSATTVQRRAANDTAAEYAPGTAAVLFEITNDLYFGATAATAQANYQGWCEDV
ncbi:MAG: SGNH/GDSL hydrolase family protein, partial [Pseudomonadota bacterium]